MAQVAPGLGAVAALAATKPLVPTKRSAEIEITETEAGYLLELTGEYGEGIGCTYGGFTFEASFLAQQKDKIDRVKNYFLPN